MKSSTGFRQPLSITWLALLALLGAVVTGCATSPAVADAPRVTTEARDAVLMVRTERHLRAALRTVDDLAGVSEIGDVHVLVCGEALQGLQPASELADKVSTAMARGTRLVACGMAMEQAGITAGDLLEGVEIVPNALAEALALQARGFVSVEL